MTPPLRPHSPRPTRRPAASKRRTRLDMAAADSNRAIGAVTLLLRDHLIGAASTSSTSASPEDAAQAEHHRQAQPLPLRDRVRPAAAQRRAPPRRPAPLWLILGKNYSPRSTTARRATAPTRTRCSARRRGAAGAEPAAPGGAGDPRGAGSAAGQPRAGTELRRGRRRPAVQGRHRAPTSATGCRWRSQVRPVMIVPQSPSGSCRCSSASTTPRCRRR